MVALLGPRQCGKTTLARQLVPADSANTFDLEDPISLARLDEPLTSLGELRGTVVIDEVQRRPELFPVLRISAGTLQELGHAARLNFGDCFAVAPCGAGAAPPRLRRCGYCRGGFLNILPISASKIHHRSRLPAEGSSCTRAESGAA
ncbi:MAG: AAA family ATPase [Cyanobium sp.]